MIGWVVSDHFMMILDDVDSDFTLMSQPFHAFSDDSR